MYNPTELIVALACVGPKKVRTRAPDKGAGGLKEQRIGRTQSAIACPYVRRSDQTQR